MAFLKRLDWRSGFWWAGAVGAVVLAAGILRLFKGSDCFQRADQTTLLYFGTAAALFVLKHVKSLKVGDLQLELDRLREQVEEHGRLAGIAEDQAKIGHVPDAAKASPPACAPEGAGRAPLPPEPGPLPDDPWKGVFGGRSVSKPRGRELTAQVHALKLSPGWYAVELAVRALPGFGALAGQVQFFIHPSFPNNRPIVEAVGGSAILRLKAWGAFTVGALADGGETRLELDLAGLPSAPAEFRGR